MKVTVTQSCPTLWDPGFSRSEYWSGQPIPSPGDLPDLGIKPRSPTLQADSLLAEPQGKPKKTKTINAGEILSQRTPQETSINENSQWMKVETSHKL